VKERKVRHKWLKEVEFIGEIRRVLVGRFEEGVEGFGEEWEEGGGR